MVSLALDYALWGERAGGYHVTNLLSHLLASVLAYVVCAGLTAGRRAALVAGLIFAVHPVHVEPTAWVKCREELFAGLGVLLSFISFRRSLGAKRPWAFGATNWWLISLFTAIGAYLCKQNALVLPAVLSGYLWYTRSDVLRERGRAALTKVTVHWLVAVGLAVWRLVPPSVSLLPAGAGAQGPAQPGVGAVLWTVLSYLRLTVLPVGLNAARDIRRMPTAGLGHVVAGAIVLYVAVRVVLEGRRSAFWLFWAAVFSIPLLRVPLSEGRPIAEQRLYLPSLAFCAIAGLGLEAGVRRARRRRASPGAAVALVLAWATASTALATHRSLDWHDPRSLWSATTRSSPGHPGVLQNMGNAYWGRKQWARALHLLMQARELEPPSPELLQDIAKVFIVMGRPTEAERYLREVRELSEGGRLGSGNGEQAEGRRTAN